MMITVVEKLMPAAAKLGTKAILEIVGVASIGAGVVNFGLDKGTAFAKEKITNYGEKKRAELEEKKAAILAQKEAAVNVVTEEVPAEAVKVEEKPKTSKKKNK